MGLACALSAILIRDIRDDVYDLAVSKRSALGKSLFSPSYDRFLRLLRAARTGSGLTQADAARLLGKPQSFIAKCEQGERRVDVVELIEFCRIYGCSFADFARQLDDRKPRRNKPKMG